MNNRKRTKSRKFQVIEAKPGMVPSFKLRLRHILRTRSSHKVEHFTTKQS